MSPGPGATTELGFREVRHTAATGEDHIVVTEGDDDVGVRGCIV